ncbi:MAG: alpha/beta hydrolase [Candidatus Nanopelagicales bacterium]
MSTAKSRDGSRITVDSMGAGPGIVLLHGAGISGREYERLATGLSRAGFSAHRYNRRGRLGNASLTGRETLQDDVDDLAAVLAETGSTRVFGHSGGGFVAVQASHQLPVSHIAVYNPAVAVTGCDFPQDFVVAFEQALAAGDEARAVALMGRDINREDPGARLPLAAQILMMRGFLRTPIGRHDGRPAGDGRTGSTTHPRGAGTGGRVFKPDGACAPCPGCP